MFWNTVKIIYIISTADTYPNKENKSILHEIIHILHIIFEDEWKTDNLKAKNA